MIPSFFSLLLQCLLSMSFWVKVIYQDFSSTLQTGLNCNLDGEVYKQNDGDPIAKIHAHDSDFQLI